METISHSVHWKDPPLTLFIPTTLALVSEPRIYTHIVFWGAHPRLPDPPITWWWGLPPSHTPPRKLGEFAGAHVRPTRTLYVYIFWVPIVPWGSPVHRDDVWWKTTSKTFCTSTFLYSKTWNSSIKWHPEIRKCQKHNGNQVNESWMSQRQRTMTLLFAHMPQNVSKWRFLSECFWMRWEARFEEISRNPFPVVDLMASLWVTFQR